MTDLPPKTGRAARAQDEESVDRRQKLDSWQKALSERSITEILRYRDVRGIGNDELRRRLGALGWQLTRDSLASILAGKRKTMPVGDIILFAQALNVPPSALIFPVWTNQWTPLSPIDVEKRSAYRQVKWFTGTDPNVGAAHVVAPDKATTDEYYDVGDIVSRQEEIDEWLHTFAAGNGNLLHVELTSEERARIESEVRDRLVDIAEVRRYLRSVYPGIELAELRPAIAFIDQRDWRMPPLPIFGYETPAEAEQWASFQSIRTSKNESPA